MVEVKIMKEVARLLNTWGMGYETELLEQFATWCNQNLITDRKIVEVGNYWTVRVPIVNSIHSDR